MRRCVSCVLLVSMAFLFGAFPAYADDMTGYELKDLGMTISFPSNYAVITRENLNDLSFENADLTREELLEILEEGNIYLGTSEPGLFTSWNITVSKAENTLGIDLNQVGDAVLTLIDDYMSSDMEEKGVSDLDVYTTPEATFMRFNALISDSLLGQHGVFYVTTHDDLLIYINMVPTLGELDEEDEDFLKTVVDSIRFDAKPQQEESGRQTDEGIESEAKTTYTDVVTNTSFSVPDGWAEAPFVTQTETLSVKFKPQDARGVYMIIYSAFDVMDVLSDEEREVLNQNEALVSDAANEFIKTWLYGSGFAESDIESVVYGDNEYLVGTRLGETIGETINTIYAQIYKNGYFYVFQFQGWGDNVEAYRQDFESLLASVQFPD